MRLPRSIDKPVRHAMRHPLVRRALVGAAATWTLAALAGLAYSLPAARHYDAVSDKLASITQTLVDADRQQAIVQSYRKDRRELPGIEARLNAPLQQTGLISRVRDLARREHMTVTDESFREGDPYEHWDVIEQDLTVRGRYRGLAGFIAGLDRLPTWTVIGDLRVARTSDPGRVTATVQLLTYGVGRHESTPGGMQ